MRDTRGLWEKWPHKWPRQADEDALLQAIKRIGLPARLRLAPFGRDCPGESCDCSEAHECKLGDITACDPIFKEEDWVHYDAHLVQPEATP